MITDRFPKGLSTWQRPLRYLFYGLIIGMMANLNPLTDQVLHPEIAYFHESHCIIGGIMALLTAILCALLESHIRRQEEQVRHFAAKRLGWFPWILALAWTILTGSLLGWAIFHRQQEMLTVAMNKARTVYEKDLIYYRWAAQQGGLFVPVTAKTPPNPYLKDRGVKYEMETISGRELALVNPEYMIRQVYEIQTPSHDVLGHITSLTPIRAANAADPWERKALAAFEKGRKEVCSIEEMNGQRYFRLMRPMVTEAECLKCHADQGYQVGDIRGGISVSVSMELLHKIYGEDIFILSLAHGALWLLGLLGIFLGAFRIAGSIREKEQAETRTRAVIDNMLDGLITLNEDGTIESLNASAAKTFGYKASEVVGRDIDQLVRFPGPTNGSDPPGLESDLQAAMGGPKEFAGKRQGGSSFPLEMSLSAMRLGKRKNYIAMVRDITEEEVRKTEALRAGQMAAIGELAAGVAHEINNPVNGIMNYSQVLLDELDGVGDDASRDILTRIIKESERVAVIVRNLLAFARQRDEVVEEVRIKEIIDDCVALLLYQLNKDGIIIEVDIPEELPCLRGNPQQLHQVFLNLLTNARYALNERYQGHDPGKRLAIRSSVVTLGGRSFVRITVTDWGVGIPQEIINRIFDTLFTTKPPGEGTGVGLSISKGLVRDHRGQLYLESVLGDYTTATVDLPVCPEEGDGA